LALTAKSYPRPFQDAYTIAVNDRRTEMMFKRIGNELRYHAAGNRVLTAWHRIRATKYSPDQPRDVTGRWIDWVGHGEDRPASSSDSEVAGLWNEANRAKCEAQFDSDMFHCSFVAQARYRSACENQAMTRRNTCMKDDPIPPLIYRLADAQ
jgi:hypothetical protein